jgi:DNA polymerase-3 subunit delta'
MIGLDEILGQPQAVEVLRRMIASDRVPHALILQGPGGVGKATTALAFAASLLCADDGERACGACDACRLFELGSHPDFTMVKLLPKPSAPKAARTKGARDEDLRKVIIVEQIRDLTRLVGLSPRQSKRRVFLIDPADQMNHEAQNALLKTLEEPPGQAVLLLIASRPHLLRPTVRSRCFGLRFGALPVDELATLLERRGVPADEAPLRATLAEGRPGKAFELDLAATLERRSEILDILESLASPRAPVAEMPVMAAALAGKNERTLVTGLELLQTLLRDSARAVTQAPEAALVHADLGDRLSQLGSRLGAPRAAAIVAAAERLRGELRFNLNRTLIAESLLAAVAGGPVP